MCRRRGGVWEEAYVLSAKAAKFRVLHDKQFLDERCGIEKNSRLGNDYV